MLVVQLADPEPAGKIELVAPPDRLDEVVLDVSDMEVAEGSEAEVAEAEEADSEDIDHAANGEAVAEAVLEVSELASVVVLDGEVLARLTWHDLFLLLVFFMGYPSLFVIPAMASRASA